MHSISWHYMEVCDHLHSLATVTPGPGGLMEWETGANLDIVAKRNILIKKPEEHILTY